MLKIIVPETVVAEEYDETKNEFIPVTTKQQTLQLEHSLVSVSKWEAKWHKSYLSNKAKTREEFIDYIRCMTLTQNVDPRVYQALTPAHLAEVSAYIDASMTATTLPKRNHSSSSREKVTSELIYYWMIAHNIPFECQKWHLNRLLTLIDLCNVKGQKPKKMSQSELRAQYRAINAANKRKYHTRG